MRNILASYKKMLKDNAKTKAMIKEANALMNAKVSYKKACEFIELENVENVFKYKDRCMGSTTFAEFIAVKKALDGETVAICSPYMFKSTACRFKYDNGNIISIYRDKILLNNFGSITILGNRDICSKARGMKIDWLILDDYAVETYDLEEINSVRRLTNCSIIKVHKSVTGE